MFKLTFACILLLAVSFADDAFGVPTSTGMPLLKVDDIDVTDIEYRNRIDEYHKRSVSLINAFLTNESSFMNAVSNCDSEQLKKSEALCDSMENLMKTVHKSSRKLLSSVLLPEIDVSIVKDENNTGITNWSFEHLALRDSVIRGLENASLTSLCLNLCLMKNDIDIEIPKLELESEYSLKGSINDSEISGDGNLNVVIEELKYYEKSNLICQKNSSKNDWCELAIDSKRDMKMKNVTVKITGIKYKDMDESQINDAINNFIQMQMNSDGNEIMKTIDRMLMDHKNMMAINPPNLLRKLKHLLDRIKGAKHTGHLSALDSNLHPTVKEIADNVISKLKSLKPWQGMIIN